jgi:cytochrome c2
VRQATRIVLVAAASILVVGGAAKFALAGHAAPQAAAALPQGTYTIKTALSTRQEVPAPKGSARGAGTFTATLKITGSKASLAWKLTFAHLSGAATAAHVHFGAAGKPGQVAVPLCAPCTSGAHKAGSISTRAAVAMVDGTAYVNVHTKLNAAGEIRGQIKAKVSSGGSGGGAGANPFAGVVVTVTPALVAQGKALSTKYSCEGCHTIDGTQSTGPTWKGLAGRNVRLTNGQLVKADDAYLLWAIEQPDAQIHAGYSSGIMSTAIGSIPLSQAKAMVAYIKSVK